MRATAHGYDTRDYLQVDCRLGTREDLQKVCAAFHQAGLRVILDGVFNHVGRGFWAFRDVQEKKWDSPYKDWFCLSFEGNSPYNDGFWYEAWEGCYELVKLNLQKSCGGELSAERGATTGWRTMTSTGCGWTWPIAWTRVFCGRSAPAH